MQEEGEVMSDQNPKVTRRDVLRSMAAAGIGGLALGGVVGYLAGSAGGASAPAATTAGEGAAAPKAEIKVVGIFPLSGFIAADGQEMRNGTVMAIDEINALGGVLGHPLKYIEIDDVDSNSEQVATAFQRAVDVEQADVIFSGYHLGAGPEQDIVANAGRLYYHVNTGERFKELYRNDPAKYGTIFQTDPTEASYGPGFILWAEELVTNGLWEPANGRTSAILAGDDPYGTLIANTFEAKAKELGWTITMRENFTVGQVTDFNPMLSKVRGTPPDLLFTTTFSPADNAAMIKQWAANPLPALVYQQYGPSVPEYLELAGDAANGVIWSTVLGVLPDAHGNAFRERYRAKYNQAPGWSNAGGNYDAVWVWARAVHLAGDPFDYKKVAQMTNGIIHRGVTGGISFEYQCGLAYPTQINDPSLGQAHLMFQIQNKEHKVVWPTPYTMSEYQTPPWFDV